MCDVYKLDVYWNVKIIRFLVYLKIMWSNFGYFSQCYVYHIMPEHKCTNTYNYKNIIWIMTSFIVFWYKKNFQEQ